MSEENTSLLERLKILIPINELSVNLQNKLLKRAQIIDVKKSQYLFKQGDKDNYSYYLFEGKIELYANNQLNSIIQSNTDRARYALAHLQPRQFSARAKTPLKVLIIDRNHLDQLLLLAQESSLGLVKSRTTEMKVDEIDGVDDEADWMTQMLQSKLFSRIPMTNIHQLFSLLEPVEKKVGEVVIKQGDQGEHYYIISEGRCVVSRKPSPRSKDIKIAELKVGDSFGEEGLISNSRRNATVTMITNGVLMQLAKTTFIDLIKNPILQSLSFADAKALVSEGAQWLDVRFPNEHKESFIKDSINIPLNSLRLKSDDLDSTKKYILYCDTGGRSSSGVFMLIERGFDVCYLEGGLVNNPEAIGIQLTGSEPGLTGGVQAGIKNRVEEGTGGAHKGSDTLEITPSKVKGIAERKKKLEDIQKKLSKIRKNSGTQEKQDEVKAEKTQQEALRLKKLKEEAKNKMLQKKKRLEEIYNKNAREMERLQKEKKQTEEKIHKEKEKLEQQTAAARKQLEEAARLRQEIEASKKILEKQVEKK